MVKLTPIQKGMRYVKRTDKSKSEQWKISPLCKEDQFWDVIKKGMEIALKSQEKDLQKSMKK